MTNTYNILIICGTPNINDFFAIYTIINQLRIPRNKIIIDLMNSEPISEISDWTKINDKYKWYDTFYKYKCCHDGCYENKYKFNKKYDLFFLSSCPIYAAFAKIINIKNFNKFFNDFGKEIHNIYIYSSIELIKIIEYKTRFIDQFLNYEKSELIIGENVIDEQFTNNVIQPIFLYYNYDNNNYTPYIDSELEKKFFIYYKKNIIVYKHEFPFTVTVFKKKESLIGGNSLKLYFKNFLKYKKKNNS